MIPLLIATSNAGKFKEFKELLGSHFDSLPLTKTAPQVAETGRTCYENALIKALAYYKFYQRPVLSDDSGLEVDALNGEPGVDSATYGGEKIAWNERWDFLYKNLQKHREKPWTARFRCVLCYYDGKRPPVFFEATVEGRIAKNPKGSEGFGYDPVFYCDALAKTLGEATPSEKAQVSHRAKATQKFVEWALVNSPDNVS